MRNHYEKPSSELRRNSLMVLLTKRGYLSGNAYQVARYMDEALEEAMKGAPNTQLILADQALKAIVASAHHRTAKPESVILRAREVATALADRISDATPAGKQHLMRCGAVANRLLDSPEGARASGAIIARVATHTTVERPVREQGAARITPPWLRDSMTKDSNNGTTPFLSQEP